MQPRILVVDDSPTIRKVVSSILATGSYQALPAEDGVAALAVLEKEKVELVLVDFVMPKMNGYQFCRELRRRAHLANTPVVLMSAKSDRIKEQFVQQTGAVDAITKPFDARGLLAVVEAALQRHQDHRRKELLSTPEITSTEDGVDDCVDSLRPNKLDLSSDASQRRLQSAAEFAAAIAEVVVHELVQVPDVPRGVAKSFVEAIRLAMTPQNMDALAALLRSLDFGDDKRQVLSGDLSVISLAEVLQMLAFQRRSGALTVNSRGREVTLYLREGDLDLASARAMPDQFLLSRFLVSQGFVERSALDRVLDQSPPNGRLLGEVLVERGLVSSEQITTALEIQTSELLFEAVRWTEGRFAFIVGGSSPASDSARLELPTGGLVMEGFRRVDEWRLIEGSFDFDDVLYRDEAAMARLGHDSPLTAKEAMVLESIDGNRTVRELIQELEGSPFELSKILFQLLNAKLVQRGQARAGAL
jgi:DNA-binding response OmpR family regulator